MASSAAEHFSYFLIALFFKDTKIMSIPFNMTKIEQKDLNKSSHLKYQTVSEYCVHRDEACLSNNTNVCAMKFKNKTKSYMDFKNGCYLFLANMCDHPEDEYYIVTSGTCEEYLVSRRNNDDDQVAMAIEEEQNSTEDKADEVQNSTEIKADNSQDAVGEVTEDPALRQAGTSTAFSPLYDMDTAYDGHICPHSCTNTYSPVCINVNRGFGLYFKMMNFVNHCSADIYYCRHYREFSPPPNENENVRSSPLSWSFCGASRYLQFARFSEVTSSLGHYGWLHGDQKFSHIVDPKERSPGYG